MLAADPCLPVQLVRARHYGYTATGIPKVRQLLNIQCADGPPDFPGARHFAYTAAGKPKLVYPWQCCDALCTDADVLAGACYKHPVEWPFGEGPGLSKELMLHAFDTATCWSARTSNCTDRVLTYSAVDGKWHGTLALKGGTLTLVFKVVDAVTLKLTWSGCGDTGATVTSTPDCQDPMLVAFLLSPPYGCCDCGGANGTAPVTDEGPQITVWIAGNCRRVVWGRHVRYTGGGMPVVAKEKPCVWDQDACYFCDNMTCPLVAVVSSSDPACASLVGTFAMPRNTGAWRATLPAGPPVYTLFRLTCADGPADPVENDPSCGDATLQLDLVCGADSAGFDTVTIRAGEMEDLDVTFTVLLSAGADPRCCTSALTVRILR